MVMVPSKHLAHLHQKTYVLFIDFGNIQIENLTVFNG